jgi:hypothetical protein
LAIGGTTLKLTSSNTISSETAWSTTFSPYYGIEGGGGGVSSYESEPSFQLNSIGNNGGRSTPDVSWDANPSTGVAIYDSYRESGWGYVGGTSVGAPSWAGVIALADQQSIANGHGSLSTLQVESTLYGLYSSSGGSGYANTSAYAQDFRDTTSGNNGYGAVKGYDLATGLGTPKVNQIVQLLGQSAGLLPAAAPSGFSSGTSGGSVGHHSATTEPVGSPIASSTSALSLSSLLVANAPSSLSLIASNGSGLSMAGFGAEGSSALSLAAANAPLITTANGLSPSAPSDVAAQRDAILFGASGWNGSTNAWRLSTLGLFSAGDPLSSLLSDAPWDQPPDQPDTDLKWSDVAGPDLVTTGDTDAPPPGVFKGGEGDEGDGGDAGDGGE